MLIHPMAERLRNLGMTAMADAFLEMQTNSAAADLAREDWLGLLLDREVTARDHKRIGRRLRQARPHAVEGTRHRSCDSYPRRVGQSHGASRDRAVRDGRQPAR